MLFYVYGGNGGNENGRLLPPIRQLKKSIFYNIFRPKTEQTCCWCGVYDGLERILSGVLDGRHPCIGRTVERLNAAQIFLSYKHIRHIIPSKVFTNLKLLFL